jgi:hypothetical protein
MKTKRENELRLMRLNSFNFEDLKLLIAVMAFVNLSGRKIDSIFQLGSSDIGPGQYSPPAGGRLAIDPSQCKPYIPRKKVPFLSSAERYKS